MPQESSGWTRPVRTVNREEPVLFGEAKVGQTAYVYREADGSLVFGEFAFVTELDWFDDRSDEVRLVRQRWLLLDAEEYILPDPHALHEGEGDDED